MPSQDGIGLNNLSQTEQAWPEPRHPHQQDPVTPPQPETSWCSPQGDVELMPQKEVLNFKPACLTARIPPDGIVGNHRCLWDGKTPPGVLFPLRSGIAIIPLPRPAFVGGKGSPCEKKKGCLHEEASQSLV